MARHAFLLCLLLLVQATPPLAVVATSSASDCETTCWKNKMEAPCSEGNLSVTYTTVGSDMEGEPRSVIYTVSIGDGFVSRMRGGSVQHANVHSCRKGSQSCNPFSSDKRLITDTPSVIKDIDQQGTYDPATGQWNMTYEAPVMLSAGAYHSFSHVYFNISNNTAGNGDRVRWDVTCKKSIDIKFDFDAWPVIIVWVCVVCTSLAVLRRSREPVWQFKDDDTDVEKRARTNHELNMKALTNKINSPNSGLRTILIQDKLTQGNGLSGSSSLSSERHLAKALKNHDVQFVREGLVHTLKKTPSARSSNDSDSSVTGHAPRPTLSLPTEHQSTDSPKSVRPAFSSDDAAALSPDGSDFVQQRSFPPARRSSVKRLLNLATSPRTLKSHKFPIAKGTAPGQALAPASPHVTKASVRHMANPALQQADDSSPRTDDSAWFELAPLTPPERTQEVVNSGFGNAPIHDCGAEPKPGTVSTASPRGAETSPLPTRPSMYKTISSFASPRRGNVPKSPPPGTEDRPAPLFRRMSSPSTSSPWQLDSAEKDSGSSEPAPPLTRRGSGQFLSRRLSGLSSNSHSGKLRGPNTRPSMPERRQSLGARLMSMTSLRPTGIDNPFDKRSMGLEVLRVEQREHYTIMATLYVWSAMHYLDFVEDRPVYHWTPTMFRVFKSQTYQFFMRVVALLHLILAFYEPASHYKVDMELTRTVKIAMYESILVGFYILDLGIRDFLMTAKGTEIHRRIFLSKTGDLLYVLFILWVLVDCVVAVLHFGICNPTDSPDCPTLFTKFPFISRVWRPFFLIHHDFSLKMDSLKVIHSVWGVLDVLLLGLCLMIIFALFGMINLKRCGPSTDDCNVDMNNFNFENYGESLITMGVLMSTENWEVVYWNKDFRPGMLAYFLVFTMICIFLLALFLSSIHSSFRHYRSKQVVDMLKNESYNLVAAFESLDIQGDDALSREDWLLLVAKVHPHWDRERAVAAFDKVDKNKDDKIDLDEFVYACDVLRETSTCTQEMRYLMGKALLKVINWCSACFRSNNVHEPLSPVDRSNCRKSGDSDFNDLAEVFPTTTRMVSTASEYVSAPSSSHVRHSHHNNEFLATVRARLPDRVSRPFERFCTWLHKPHAIFFDVCFVFVNVMMLAHSYDGEEDDVDATIDDVFAVVSCVHQVLFMLGRRTADFSKYHVKADGAAVFLAGPVMWVARAAGASVRTTYNLRAVRSLRLLTTFFELSYSIQEQFMYSAHGTDRSSFTSDAGSQRSLVSSTYAYGEQLVSELAYVVDIKGLWTNLRKLFKSMGQMSKLGLCVLYFFAITGMELFYSERVECSSSADRVYWFECDDFETYWNFQTFKGALLTLYQVFYTGDIKEMLRATAAGRMWYPAVVYWFSFYIMVYIMVLDTIVSNVIEQFELIKSLLEDRRLARTRRFLAAQEEISLGHETSEYHRAKMQEDSMDQAIAEPYNLDVYAEAQKKHQAERQLLETVNAVDIRQQTAKQSRISLAGRSGRSMSVGSGLLSPSHKKGGQMGWGNSNRTSMTTSSRSIAMPERRQTATDEFSSPSAYSRSSDEAKDPLPALPDSPASPASPDPIEPATPVMLGEGATDHFLKQDAVLNLTGDPTAPRPASPEDEEQTCWPGSLLDAVSSDSIPAISFISDEDTPRAHPQDDAKPASNVTYEDVSEPGRMSVDL